MQYAQEGGGPGDGPAAFSGARLERRHELGQPVGVACDLDERPHRLFVEREGVALEAVRDHRVPVGRLAGFPLAQHFRVIDLAQLDVAARHHRPHARDAAFGADRVRRPSEEQQEVAPGVEIAAGMNGQLADEMIVEEHGQLADRRIGARRGASIEEERVGEDRQPERTRQTRRRRHLHDAAERRGDGRMASRVQQHRARRGFARAREVDEPRGFIGRQRSGRVGGFRHSRRGVDPPPA